jgi:hypothetical protein
MKVNLKARLAQNPLGEAFEPVWRQLKQPG